jgi:hypothetical protein
MVPPGRTISNTVSPEGAGLTLWVLTLSEEIFF